MLLTRENALRNRMDERLHADSSAVEIVAGQYAAVIANIEATTLVELAPALIPRLAPEGLMVVSAMLGPHAAPAQLGDVRRAYSTVRQERVLRKGEWVAVVLSR